MASTPAIAAAERAGIRFATHAAGGGASSSSSTSATSYS